jgi:hypothetical protein
MGKTFSTGLLTNGIWQDSSNNIGIGGSPSGSYKLDVTGTGRFTGALTAGSGIFGNTGTGNNVISISNNDQSNTRLRIINTGSGGQTFSIVGGNPGASNAGLAIFDETNSATRLYINPSGNVGIGTTSPGYLLDVINGSNPSLRVRNAALGGSATLLLETANDFTGTCQAYVRVLGSTGNGNSTLTFGTAGATGDTIATERMRISSTGNVIIGGTGATSNAGLTLRPVNGNTQALISIVANNASGSNPSIYMECPGAVGGGMYIDRNTSTLRVWQAGETNGVQLTNNATSWSSFSDERLKTDLLVIENAINKLSSIRAVTGRYKTDKEGISRSFIIAQDVQSVFPEAVDVLQDDIGTLSLRYTDLIPVLVKAIQELEAKVSALELK